MKKDNPILTVFTPTYNQEKYIEKCIQGVISQKTKYKFVLLISDDNSCDSTREIIELYRKKYPNIIKPIYRNENLGPMDNFVKSLNLIHTKYVALCDGDDFWTDDKKIEKQLDFLETHPEYSMCFHQTEIFYESINKKSIVFPKLSKSELSINDILHDNPIVANTAVYRWMYFEKDSLLNDFPKNIVPGDYYLNIMHAAVGKIHFVNEVMSKYRKHSEGMWYYSDNNEYQLKFYLKNGKKYLKFYKEVERKLSLNNNELIHQKNWVIWMCLKSYIKYKNNIELYQLYRNEFHNTPETFNNVYNELNEQDKKFFDLNTGLKNFVKKTIKTIYYRIKNY